MKKSVVVLAVGLALNLGGLALVWSARAGKADAAGPGGRDREAEKDRELRALLETLLQEVKRLRPPPANGLSPVAALPGTVAPSEPEGSATV